MSAEQLDIDCDPEGDPDEQAIAGALTDDDLGEPLPPPQLTRTILTESYLLSKN